MYDQKRFSEDNKQILDIFHDAGGTIKGRTRMQKLFYLLQLAGFINGFYYEYRVYGPYSEELQTTLKLAKFFRIIDETKKSTSYGGFYSIYEVVEKSKGSDQKDRREDS